MTQIASRRTGFSLIELLVAIAIIGLLLAIALPAVNSVRESSRRTQCQNNLHQFGLALRNHEAQTRQFPVDGFNEWSVAALLLPHLEQKPLFDQLRPLTRKRSALSTDELKLLETPLDVLLCPTFPRVDEPVEAGQARTTYLGNDKLLSMPLSLDNVLDGETTTIAAGEITADHAWALPGLGSGDSGANQFLSHHSGGYHVVFCGGNVTFLSESLDQNVLRALCTPRSGDTVGNF